VLAGSGDDRGGLAHGLSEVRRIVSRLELSESIRDQACQLFRSAQNEDLLRGRSIEAMAAASVYGACRCNGWPRTLDEIVADHLDYLHHEAFFVVSTTFEVTAYRTLWFGLQYDSKTVEQGETVRNGAFATVRWYDGEPVGDGHIQGQFQALKDVAGDMLDKGVFTPSTARQYLKRKLAERVGDRQELLIPTGESPFEKASLGQS